MMEFENSDPDTEVTEERIPVDQWLALRKEAAAKIDPVTAEVTFRWGLVVDPYGVCSDLPDQLRQVGRVYFARSADSDVWVSFDDLSNETRDGLWQKVHAGAYPDALPDLLSFFPLPLRRGSPLKSHPSPMTFSVRSAGSIARPFRSFSRPDHGARKCRIAQRTNRKGRLHGHRPRLSRIIFRREKCPNRPRGLAIISGPGR